MYPILTVRSERLFFFSLSLFFLLSPAMVRAGSSQNFQSAEKQTPLIELYTSEGCSSCPPAEAWLARWKENPNLWRQAVPVAFHVDYWDQLGWPDRFAKPEYTQRQRDYAARLGQDSLYTPEFIVNGQEWRGFFEGGQAPSADGGDVGILKVTATDDGRQVEATFAPETKAGGKYRLQIALLGADVVSQIRRGENGGRTLSHQFVALSYLSIPMAAGGNGTLHGAAQMPAPATPDKPAALAAWVVSDDGAFIQATGGWLAAKAQSPPENASH